MLETPINIWGKRQVAIWKKYFISLKLAMHRNQ
jgi:hypothetical protein